MQCLVSFTQLFFQCFQVWFAITWDDTGFDQSYWTKSNCLWGFPIWHFEKVINDSSSHCCNGRKAHVLQSLNYGFCAFFFNEKYFLRYLMKDHCAAYSVQDFKVILNIIHPKKLQNVTSSSFFGWKRGEEGTVIAFFGGA